MIQVRVLGLVVRLGLGLIIHTCRANLVLRVTWQCEIFGMTPAETTHGIVSVGRETRRVPRYETMLVIIRRHIVQRLLLMQLRRTASQIIADTHVYIQ